MVVGVASPVVIGFTCAFGRPCYTSSMTKVADKLDVTPVAFTDDLAEMADYLRSPEGRAAIERGLQDIEHGRMFEGKGALAAELKRRAEERRRA